MARNASNPLATALDQRIRAMVEEAVEATVRTEVREALREELAGLIGSIAPTAGAPAPAAEKAPARAKATTKRTTTRAAKAKAKPKAAAEVATGDNKCGVADCTRPYRSRGYCAAHYQAARKYGWPMPAPQGFEPPPRPSRGRPPKTA